MKGRKGHEVLGRVKTAVILAAGMGSRLSDVTNDEIPKGLLMINGKTLIERSIEKLRSVGIEKIYIVTGHLSYKYDEFLNEYKFIQTKRNRKYKATGSMTSLAILENDIKEDFLLLESDIVYEVYALIKAINYEQEDCVLLSGRTYSGDECYVEVRDDNLYKISKNINDLGQVYGELVGISKISLGLYKSMIKEYKRFNYDVEDEYEFIDYRKGSSKKYDYENAIFDVAKHKKVGYLKVENLIWGEIDDRSHLDRVKKDVLPKIEKVI